LYIQAHVMSGWIAGNYLKLNARERFFCMISAGILDVDGFGIIVSQEAYYDYHHIAGHNLLFGVIISLILALLSKQKIKCFFIYLALFHLHILMDLFGSGEDWTIEYFQPFSNYGLYSKINWALYSWQNMIANAVTLLWTIILIITKKRSPLEYIMPKLDKKWSERISCFCQKIFKSN
jgi:LexA-binding, inner membrane-associated putative hydrolase